jgi:hypothetical protein
MQRFVWLFVVAGACGAPHASPRAAIAETAPPRDASIDASPDAAADAPPAAAVVVREPVAIRIDEVDTTIADAELPTCDAASSRRRIRHGGRHLAALHERDRELWLALFDDRDGELQQFSLGAVQPVSTSNMWGPSIFEPRSRVGDYAGPILFAVRVEHFAGAPQQLVVYSDAAAICVASRALGGTAWSRRLRVELDPDATFVGIGTTDPH